MCELDHKEGWNPKNWSFQTVVLEKLLRVPWTARKSNQSILKKINHVYSLEGLMLKLKFQYFGHLMQRAISLETILIPGKIEGRGTREQQWMRWLDGIIGSMDMSFEQCLGDSEGKRSLACCSPWAHKELDATEYQTTKNNGHSRVWVKWALGSINTNASEGDRIPAELFKILKMIQLKCCTQYASKFGKLSSGHRTGKGQFSFQFQRKEMPKNAQTTTQLYSSHMLVK